MFDDCCLLLRGEFFIKDSSFECAKNTNAFDSCGEKNSQYIKIGNTSSCEINIDSFVFGKENIFNKVSPENRIGINKVNISLMVECVNKENILQAFYGEEKVEESNSINERLCFSKTNPFIITKYNPKNLVISLLDSFGNLLSFLIEGTDYNISGSKIELINMPGIDARTSTLMLDYDFIPENTMSFDLFSRKPKYKDVFFKGFNVENNNSMEVRFYRVLFAPIANFDLITKDQFFNLPLSGVVEESNNGFFKITQQKDISNEPGSPIY